MHAPRAESSITQDKKSPPAPFPPSRAPQNPGRLPCGRGDGAEIPHLSCRSPRSGSASCGSARRMLKRSASPLRHFPTGTMPFWKQVEIRHPRRGPRASSGCPDSCGWGRTPAVMFGFRLKSNILEQCKPKLSYRAEAVRTSPERPRAAHRAASRCRRICRRAASSRKSAAVRRHGHPPLHGKSRSDG